ncbi:hypothetical protein QM480_17725 [Flectobacillus sp. DC10W]|uniref:Uncharacterized protein n=1 Tax=Flectobacillus longus TaxID=2984207 RepID=A0ABT6YRW1_9BACT|nr:hypothetical protein [Flectobacillus longus]MDI9866187.1 hypothetical protein [Flectobacillus longus]
MKLKIYFLLVLGLLFTIKSYGQGLKLSDKPEEFLADAQNVLSVSGNPQAENIAKGFEKLWNSEKLGSPQKTKIASLSNFMFKKGYKPPHFSNLFDVFVTGSNTSQLSGTTLDAFLETIRKSVESNDTKTTLRLIEITKLLFGNKAVYYTNYNRLYVLDGSISFQFNDQKVELSNTTTTPTNNNTASVAPSNNDGWDDAPPTPSNNGTTPAPVEETAPLFINPGPAIVFKTINLSIVTASDSATLIGTNATLGIKDGVLLGTGGKFTWETVGLPQAFAVLDNFSMDIRNPRLKAESSTLTYADKLINPIKGVFEFQSKKRPKNVVSTFPRFMSFKNEATLKKSADFEYKGGFALSGSTILSSSLQDKYTTIVVKKDGKIAFKISGRRFVVGDSLITSPAATFTGYFAENDSIYHPLGKLVYDRLQQNLRLSKVDEGGFKEASYVDSYHKLEITADAMRWSLRDHKVDFYILVAKNVVPALFESFDYFNPERFNKISETFSFNPLVVVNNYAKKSNLTTVKLSELAKAYNKDLVTLKPVFLAMMQKGYFEYDPEVETIKLSRKGSHYLSVQTTKRDYDNLLIPSLYATSSKDTTANATLSLKDNQLIIRGVKQFYLSDSLNVFMAPYDNLIKVNKDRNFGISGELKTGNFRFRGKDLSFNYGEFSVKLNKIDSITFIPQKELAKRGRTEIGGDLKYESGTIYINKPDNKSGRQRLVEYPRLVVPTGVTAYFDHVYRGQMAYNKKVYFKVPSIDFDSLNIKDIDFVGTFYSDGIFPPFKETLISMPDNTLGFSHKVAEGKYVLYNSKSFIKFEEPLIMDKRGLHTAGEINHLTAQIQAKEAVFTQDSVNATGTIGKINEGAVGQAYFTKVDIKNYSLKWQPKVDSMLIETKGNSFEFYAASSKLEGKLLVRQSGMFGFGKVHRQDSETESDNFKFGKDGFSAEPANLMVGSNLKAAKPALFGKHMNVYFNLTTGKVNIKTPAVLKLEDSTSMYFPYTAYRTSINSAEWDINKKNITMKGDIKTSTFTSIEPSQEGLTFNASGALYEIEKQSLNISGVPFIKSADAKIIPDQGQVSIRRDAEMKTFYNAKLEIDTLTSYHKLVGGSIRILSRNAFEGDAIYRFPNLVGDTLNLKIGNFTFKEIGADDRKNKKVKAITTTAKATVDEKDKFHLSSKILYKGDVILTASEKNLKMEGFIKPETKGRSDVISWIPYKGNSTNNLTLDVQPELKSDINTQLLAGLHFRTASTGLYTTFLSEKTDAKDDNIFVVNGKFRDIPKSSKFEIGSEETEKSYEASRYIYDDAKKTLALEGTFNFFTPNNYIQGAGFADIRIDSSKYKFDQMLLVNFPMPSEVLKALSDKIVKINLDSRDNGSADEPEDKERLMSKLANLVGNKAVESIERRLKNEHVPVHTINSKLNTSLVFSKVNLRYSDQQSAFYSIGKLGLASIGGTDINSEVDGYLEIRKTNEGDEFYLYLAPNEDTWYFMGYIKGEMGVISSDAEFNNAVAAKAKGVKKGSGKNAYIFLGVGAEEKLAFVERFMEAYRVKDTKQKKVAQGDDKTKKVEKKKEEAKDGF